ncbi:DNA N-6-adenine-methyltransferase [Enterobacter pseudoroggenkampii]|uniref:DNA N-6-adenine-methyltransferase n=1 Tax=Enterobacter pseudoroggenkampii TaxID=2996112 RepID=UPI002264C55C|nr:DNA N-6-adenine-methyltransferase [Enterobacter pseudoroggenkampii]MCX8289100.1 DNA N-6-adenine-methyltransferase [Enterobacter pseudoroggenkampii]
MMKNMLLQGSDITMQHSIHNNDDEYHSPIEYINSARVVMGCINIDPASNDEAQKTVKADRYYTKDNSSLSDSVEWNGKVWMNPPYSRIIKSFTAKLVNEWDKGNTKEAIVLTNNGTDTHWFNDLASRASAICLHKGRIRFIKNGQPTTNNNKGQVITYLGNHPDKFGNEFSKYGTVFFKLNSGGESVKF